MANTTLVRITNTTSQVVPVMVNSIDPRKANPQSTIRPQENGLYQMVGGSTMTVELQRISVGQLDNLQSLGQISYA